MIFKFMKHDILDQIPTGKENAVSVRELANKCGCSDREIRRVVEFLRRDGVLVCSSCKKKGGGYYIPRNNAEIVAYFGRQLSRIGHIWAALSPFKSYLKALPVPGQLALDELAAGGDDNG